MPEERTRSIGAKMPEALHKKLRLFAAEWDLKIMDLTVELFEILLDDNDELGRQLRERVTEGRND